MNENYTTALRMIDAGEKEKPKNRYAQVLQRPVARALASFIEDSEFADAVVAKGDTILAYALSERFGFGRKRITDFLKEIIDCHIYTKDRYGEKYQDSAYAEELREKGIDIEEIEKELDDYAKERGIEF